MGFAKRACLCYRMDWLQISLYRFFLISSVQTNLPSSKTLPFMWPENVGKAVNIMVCRTSYCSTRRWLAQLKPALPRRRLYWFPFLRHNKSRREERYVFISRQNSKGFTLHGITARKGTEELHKRTLASSRKSLKTPDSEQSISQILVRIFWTTSLYPCSKAQVGTDFMFLHFCTLWNKLLCKKKRLSDRRTTLKRVYSPKTSKEEDKTQHFRFWLRVTFVYGYRVLWLTLFRYTIQGVYKSPKSCI